MDLVGSDPLRAIETAERALRGPRSQLDPATRTLAWRAVGLAARARGDLENAVAALRRAVRAATDAGDRASAAEARMTQAFVLLDLGRTSQALRQSGRAATDLDGLAQVRLRAQRALILQRCGRFAEALAEYDVVVPLLHRARDTVWEARARSNRGVLHAYRGRLGAAEQDLLRAQQLDLQDGRRVDAAGALWNLGCLARERGDVVQALERFDEADPVCDAHGMLVGTRLMDRASLLLSVGVVAEARALAQAGHQAFSAAGQAADLLECDALLSRIGLLDGDASSAVAHARAARRAAAQQERPGWLLLARLLEVLALEADPGAIRPGLIRRAQELATALDAARWPEAAAEARLAAVRIALARGRTELAVELLDRTASLGRYASAALQVQRWHAVALLRHQQGERAGAARAVHAGLMSLVRHRAGLGASDLQAHVPAIGQELARLGLRIALADGSPTRVLREVERWRGTDLRARPVRPPRDPELSAAVERLRRATSELYEASLGSVASHHLLAARAARERDVVRLGRRARAGSWMATQAPASFDELRVGLGEQVLVEYLAVDDELVAVTVPGEGVGARRSGAPRLFRLGRLVEVQDGLAHLQFALARLATGRGSPVSLRAALEGARDIAATLDRRLLQPLSSELRGSGLVVAPTEALHSVPWSLLPSGAHAPLHLVRSGTAWLNATRNCRAAAGAGGHDLFVTGPGVTSAPVAGLLPGAGARTVLSGAQATVRGVLAALDGAATAHIAAHGSFRQDNPLLSSLQLADSQLTVYDLEEVRRPPHLVVLAACHSATARILPANQLLGVAQALLTLGAGGVVATTLPTPDAQTAVLMHHLHRGLESGLSTGESLHRARSSLDLHSPAGFATSAGFDLYGC